MKGGTLIYKCRYCGKVVGNIHVPNLLEALIIINIGGTFPDSWGGFNPKITGVHSASDHIGITDLIGGEED